MFRNLVLPPVLILKSFRRLLRFQNRGRSSAFSSIVDYFCPDSLALEAAIKLHARQSSHLPRSSLNGRMQKRQNRKKPAQLRNRTHDLKTPEQMQ